MGTSEETQRRLDALEKEQPGKPDLIEDEEEKKPCNPDEIIDGRPKWSKIRQKRKGKNKKLPLEDNDKEDEEESDQVDELDFDRLNPPESSFLSWMTTLRTRTGSTRR